MAQIDGATLVARSLKQQGVQYMFGIVGVPVVPIAFRCQMEGIRYYGMRHEQSASYAAQAVSYLTGRPGACLVVSGPGMTNAISGLANAWSNCWPMILLGGASDAKQAGMGAFQEAPQVEAASPQPPRVPDAPRPLADASAVQAALDTLRQAERPLVIVGKGAAYARAEDEVREFIEKTQLPYLASPMGKGLLPDDHPLSVAAARSFALQNADVVFLMAARLNWILHYGRPPRFREDVRVIQLDIAGEEIGTEPPPPRAPAG